MAKNRIVSTRRGTCKICRRSISASGMGVHLRTHIPKVGRRTHYVIRVDNRGPFWVFLQIPGDHTLEMIDAFLRDEWLECGNHIRIFDIEGVFYDSDPEDAYVESRSMDYEIRNILKDKMTFGYRFDLKYTTELRLTVTAGNVPPLIPAEGIVPLAVHDKVSFHCDICGKEAAKACMHCFYYDDDSYDDNNSMFCSDCALKHPCIEDDKDAALNLVQSPRVGTCTYQREPRTLHDISRWA